ncbi:MAG: WG repeat-containing protein [Deltaproteobacteria bacterium]|jgi:hypothetical protein|nr:WG repeat-containing protein [Deltaproteobacteria bacterium]
MSHNTLPKVVVFFLFFWALSGLTLQASYELIPNTFNIKGPGVVKKGGGGRFHFFKFGEQLYGYVTVGGQLGISPKYSEAYNFDSFGLALAQEDGLWGVINSEGEWIILPRLVEIKIFNVDDQPVIWGRNYSWCGKINLDGDWSMKPRFQNFTNLGNGFYAVFYQGKAALMNEEGRYLTPLVYDNLKNLKPGPKGGFLLTFSLANKEGIMNSNGEVVIKARFESISPNFDENGKFIMKINGKYGVLDISDQWVIEPEFSEIIYVAKDKIFWVKEGNFVDTYFYYDLNGNKLGPIPKEKIWESVSEKPFKLTGCFTKNIPDLLGYCDVTGTVKIPQAYNVAANFSVIGLARVSKDKKFGYIDPTGKVVIDFLYEGAGDFSPSGFATVKLAGRWGLINKTGEYVIRPEYLEPPEPVNEEIYFVRKNEGYSLVKTDGKVLSTDFFQEKRPFMEKVNLAWVKKDGKWGLIDLGGKWFLPPTYDTVGDYAETGLAPVTYGNDFALVDNRGEKLVYTTRSCDQDVVKNKNGTIIWPTTPLDCV